MELGPILTIKLMYLSNNNNFLQSQSVVKDDFSAATVFTQAWNVPSEIALDNVQCRYAGAMVKIIQYFLRSSHRQHLPPIGAD